MKNEDEEMKMARRDIEMALKQRFKISFWYRIEEFFEKVGVLIFFCIYVIFKPLNLIIIGLLILFIKFI